MFNEVKVKLYRLTKSGNTSSFIEVGNLEAKINQVDNTQLSLYPELPIGNGFEMIIENFNYNTDIEAGDKFIIVDKYNSQFKNNDVFIVYNDFQKQKILDNIILKGLVVKQ